MRFARISEEIILRHKELAEKIDKDGNPVPGKGALQTLHLYQIILLRSWATGVSDMTLQVICQTYGLDLDNSYRRLKVLRTKGWVDSSTEYIKPLLIHRANDPKAVKITAESKNETVKITAGKDSKAVKITANNCKNYSESDEKTVKITAENDATSNEISGSGDAMIFKDLKSNLGFTTHDEKTAGVSVEDNGNLSKFSLPECFSYVEICRSKGDDIKNPRALAITLRNNGSADAFIEAELYPEQPAQIIEYDDDAPESRLHEALDVLIDLSADGHDLSGQKQFYAPEDWAWLMEQLEIYK